MITKTEPRFIHKGPKCVLNLRQGQTVYYVSALGIHSSLEKFTVVNKAQVRTSIYENSNVESDYHFLEVKRPNTDYTTTFSLLDCNVIKKNRYNNHRLFTSKKKAESYLKLCLQDIVLGFREREKEDFFYEDPCDYYWGL